MYWAFHSIGVFLSSFNVDSAKTDSKESRRASLLSPEDYALYQKVVDDLINFTQGNCVVIFRQAASWETVRHGLIDAPDSLSVWKHQWERIISDLSMHRQKVHDCALSILHCTAKDPKISKYSKEIDKAKARIQTVLRAAQSQLANDNSNSRIMSCPQAAHVVEYLNENWHQLNVFSEWTEVDMDSDALCVQIQRSVFSKRIAAMLVNPSTKGIFWLKEKPCDSNPMEKTESQEKEGLSNSPRLKSMALERYNLPKDPSMPALLRRSSASSLTLDEEGFVNCEILKDGEEPTSDHIKKSELGDRLHRIVSLAVDAFNDTMAKKEGRVNQEPRSSETVGPRTDFSLFFSQSRR